MIAFDGLEDAVVGFAETHTQPTRLVYDYGRIIDILFARFSEHYDTEEEAWEAALEWFDFNIACLWAGPGTPSILYSTDLPDYEEALQAALDDLPEG